jgi:hypothetical protein
MISPAPKRRARYTAAALLAIVALAVIVAGCGGGSSSDQVAAGVGPTEAPAHHKFAVASRDAVSGGSEGAGSEGGSGEGGSGEVENIGATTIDVAKFPNGKDNDEISPTGAKPIKPCHLVTKSEASGILGGKVRVSERPQGPTCVYVSSGRQITLAVAETPLRALREGARHVSKLTIAGHTGYCLRYQATSIVVAVPAHRVLQINGPCPAGARFAAFALPRLY